MLTSANLWDADLSDACSADVVMEGVFCMGAKFDRANLRIADLYWAIAFEASFCDCDLTGAEFQGAGLKETDFTGARLVRAKLGRDNLGGSTELQDANLETADLNGADRKVQNTTLGPASRSGLIRRHAA